VHEQTCKVLKDLFNIGKEMKISMRSAENTRRLTETENELEILCKNFSNLADEMIAKVKQFEVTKKRNIRKSDG
jgi:hypothetical protein